MSEIPHDDPVAGDAASCAAIERVILPRLSEVGGLAVRRALPSVGKKLIGPFIFFDQFGPHEFLLGQGLDVRPHPHIGLSTVSYLFDGAITHRDSLGVVQPILPGDVNLMTAGRGITHSERSPGDQRTGAKQLFGVQVWTALPTSHEEQEPTFQHVGIGELPRIEAGGKRVRVILGAMYGEESPIETPHPTFYAEAVLAPGAILPLDADYAERAIYVVSGAIDIAGDRFEAGRLLVFRPGDRISVLGLSHARLMLLGGEPMDGPRHIWWNFVSSRKERIDQAADEWKTGRFDTVPGDTDMMPL